MSRRCAHPVRLACLVGPLLGIVVAAPVEASSLTGSLGSDASSAALLSVDCSNSGSGPPASLTIQVSNRAPVSGAVVSAQIRRANAATNTTDPVDDDGLPSPAVFVNGGEGVYDVFVDKSTAGSESFELVAQCWTGAGGTGAPAGTRIFGANGASVPGLGVVGALALCAGLATAGIRRLRATGRAA